jgi:hypothetical protein
VNVLETYYTYAKLATAAYIDLSSIGDYWRTPGGSVLPGKPGTDKNGTKLLSSRQYRRQKER